MTDSTISSVVDSVEDRIEKLAETVAHDIPTPSMPWIMFQSWRNLLFASWPLPVDAVRSLVPAALEIDTFDGQAWVSVVPFGVADLHWRDLPPIPDSENYLELNLRTYVTYAGVSAVYFLSLDCTAELAVWVAKHFYDVPFYEAQINCVQQDGTFYFTSQRTSSPPASFVAGYTPVGDPAPLAPGTLDSFLAERYSLFVADPQGSLHRCDIRHAPWMMQAAQANFKVDTIASAFGITLPDTPPHLAFAAKTDTLIWPLEKQE
jgi:uncharacterized protein YqjF (DUF2071 family)